MTFRQSSTFWALAMSICVLTPTTAALADQPRVDNVFKVESASNTRHGKILIEGENFGSASRASPIVHDFATRAIILGEDDTFHTDNLSDFDELPTRSSSEYRWAATGSTPTVLALNRDKRHENADGQYYGWGIDSRPGWHVAHGGRDNRGEWVGDRHLYYAFWMRMPLFNPVYTWRIRDPNQDFRAFSYSIQGMDDLASSETPSLGEAVTVGTQEGRLVGVDQTGDTDTMYLEMPGNRNASNLAGETITGLSSGATATFPSPDGPDEAEWYGAPTISISRVWQDPSREGYSPYSWGRGPAGWGREGDQPWQGTRDDDAYRDALVAGEWHLFEWEMSYDEDRMQSEVVATFNGKEVGRGELNEGIHADWRDDLGGPTPAQMGANMRFDLLAWDIDEIYIDNTRRRVLLADAENLDEASKYEIQTPLRWSDDVIEVRVNLGSHAKNEQLFVFVFDKFGRPSTKGFPVCLEECQARPVAPESVEISSR